jgi:tetratricopeptide (TPR) repeat protein
MDRLTKVDPGNSAWQSDLVATSNNIGLVYTAQEKLSEALKSYQTALAIMDRLTKGDPDNAVWHRDRESVIGGIGGLAHHFLLASNFTAALDAADQAISAGPDEIWLYANRAHALMFLGRTAEARAIYLQYRDRTDVQNGKSWVITVLEDFDELNKAGLTAPLMEEIRKRFAAKG